MYDRSLIWLLQRVNLSTLVVWGADDAIIPVDSGRQIHEAIPGSRLEIVRECGHLPHVEKPDEFSRLLLELLAEG